MTKIRGLPPRILRHQDVPAGRTATHFHSDFRRSFAGSFLAAAGVGLACCTVAVMGLARELHVDPFFDLLGSLLKLLERLFGEVLAGQQLFQLAGRAAAATGLTPKLQSWSTPLASMNSVVGGPMIFSRSRASVPPSRSSGTVNFNCFPASSIVFAGVSGWSRLTASTATLALSLYFACNCSSVGIIGSPSTASVRQKWITAALPASDWLLHGLPWRSTNLNSGSFWPTRS